MIIGQDKEKVAGLVAENQALRVSHDALAAAIINEAASAREYLNQHGKSQKRKLDSMILFCGNLITICERSTKAVKREEAKTGD